MFLNSSGWTDVVGRENEPDYDLVAYEREYDWRDLLRESMKPTPVLIVKEIKPTLTPLAAKVMKNWKEALADRH